MVPFGDEIRMVSDENKSNKDLGVFGESYKSDMMSIESEDKSHRYPKRVVKVGPSYCSPYMDMKCMLTNIITAE